MKNTLALLLAAALGGGFFAGGCAKKPATTSNRRNGLEVAAQLKSFVAEKETQENTLAAADEKDYAQYKSDLKLPDYRPFFAAATKGDWQTVSNLWSEMEARAWSGSETTNRYPHGRWQQPVRETFGAVEAFVADNEKYSEIFGDDIIQSIPPGSIYFGGTDAGQFIVAALEKSQVDGDPFFTLTQGALADGSYLNYLRSIYGDKIKIPTAEDAQKCFQEYSQGAQQRLQNHTLKPGEDIQVTQGRVQISGRVAVMEINGLLVKTIFDQNTNREFYIEESFPLDWMYPNLEPHGLIMKINRQPLTSLADAIVRSDSDYWTQYVTPMIGDWLHTDTTVQEIAAFAEKIYVAKDLSGFSGDPQFVQNKYSCKMFSKSRSSIAGLYAWRAQHAADVGEKKRMNDAADFAFRQAFALCPYSSEVAFRYANLLLSEGRTADAVLIAETAAEMPQMEDSNREQMRSVIKNLKQFQTQN